MSAEKRRLPLGNEVQQKKKRFHSLTGQITAQSHFIYSTPTCTLLEVCTRESVNLIICEKLDFVLSAGKPSIGRHYKFTDLTPTALRLRTGPVKCFKVSRNTTWCEVNDEDETYHPDCYKDLTTIQGKVTEVNFNLGILTLNNSVSVITGTCSRIAMVKLPQEGQTVTVFNVHRVNINKESATFVMCVKSYLSVEGESCSKISPINWSGVLLTLGDRIRDYRLILWLQDCSTFIKNSFSDEFLSSNGIPMCEYDDFRLHLLESITKFVVKKFNVPKMSVIEEFFSSDHIHNCGSLKKEMIPISILNVLQFAQVNPSLEDEQDGEGSNSYWQYAVNRSSENLLIGVVTFQNVSHRLTFTDAYGSVACVILPKDGQILEGKDLARIVRKVVLISEYHVVHEKFFWQEEDKESTQELSHKALRCLAVHVDKILVMSSFVKDWRSPTGAGEHFISTPRSAIEYLFQVFTPEASKDSSDNDSSRHSLGDSSKRAVSSNGKTVDCPESSCVSRLKGPPLSKFMSQYIYVQTKTTPSAPKAGKPARCHILVSLLGSMFTSSSTGTTPSREGSYTKPIFIALEGPLLGVHPMISVNTVYEIRFPLPFDRSFFQNGLQLSTITGMQKMLPTTVCVTLPSSCEIHLVSSCDVPSSSLKFRDCYGIVQAVEGASIKELINIKGYIVERYHQDPRFAREKINVKANGFGIPGCKIIALILRDTPPESQTGSPATIYLSNWSTLQYPLSLVPGAKVVFRFVVKVIPRSESSGSVYFRTSILSSVEILELQKSEWCDEYKGKENLLGPRSLLVDILSENVVGCKWMTVSMANLSKVTFSATCSFCKHPYENGHCSFVGCSAPRNPSIFSQACFRISDFGNAATVFVPHAIVEKLFLTSWESVTLLAQACGRLEYNSCEDISHLSLEQRVFRAFCKGLMLSERFHLLCRPFNSRKDSDKSFAQPLLYAVDIYPVALHMAIL